MDREDNTGLEFEYQLSIPMLTNLRLYQIKRLGRINTVALRRTRQHRQLNADGTHLHIYQPVYLYLCVCPHFPVFKVGLGLDETHVRI